MSTLHSANGAPDATLLDGSVVCLRQVTPADEVRLREFFAALDPRSQAFRFFCGGIDLSQAAHELAKADAGSLYGLIAARHPGGPALGHGVYVSLGKGQAEVAFAVAHDLQGHGLGTILLNDLAAVAADNGIDTFLAEVLPQNHRMLEVFCESGFPVETETEEGTVRVRMATARDGVRRRSDGDRGRSA
ncbi:MAG TPA: GNAT family N-acetyltransferase [Solirubrobacterales bacterium]|nr:GNAT family N-acetyltransferase [Solirubrobacterales bacterium]